MKSATEAAAYWADHIQDGRDRHWVVKQLCWTKHPTHASISAAICDLILERHGDVGLMRPFVMLLCLVLARTHDPVHIGRIMRLKNMSMDMSMTIDSNLLFEFSPNGKRETCVEDTIAALESAEKKRAAKAMPLFPKHVTNSSWFEEFRKMATGYSKAYGSETVMKIWNMYKSESYIGREDFSLSLSKTSSVDFDTQKVNSY